MIFMCCCNAFTHFSRWYAIFLLRKHPNSFGILVGCAICGFVPLPLPSVICCRRHLAHCLFVYETLHKCGCPFFQQNVFGFSPFLQLLGFTSCAQALYYLSLAAFCLFFLCPAIVLCIIFILYQSSNTYCRGRLVKNKIQLFQFYFALL